MIEVNQIMKAARVLAGTAIALAAILTAPAALDAVGIDASGVDPAPRAEAAGVQYCTPFYLDSYGEPFLCVGVAITKEG